MKGRGTARCFATRRTEIHPASPARATMPRTNVAAAIPTDSESALRLTLLAIVFAILAAFFAATRLHAAPLSLAGTDVRVLPRSANGRSYSLYIGLPASYATSPLRRYPVVYLLDAYWDFPLVNCDAGNLLYDQAMPECILVGIAYSGTAPDVSALRQIDMTPGADPSIGTNDTNSGHAQEFLGVIASEFIPYVEREFRVDSAFRVLAGSSYGGLFTCYAIFERPGLFHAYLAPSPALWWRSRYIAGREREHAASHPSLPARIFLSFASEESTWIKDSTRDFAAQLRQTGYANLAVAVREIEGERHSATKAESFNRGLRFAFALRAPSGPSTLHGGFDSHPTLVNLSTRGVVAGPGRELIAGLVVEGMVPKRLLIRAAGPALEDLGVGSALIDPRLTVMAGGAAIASNDNWGDFADQPGLREATRQAQAFVFASASRDAAAVVTLEPGAYTVVVDGVDGATGNALVEAYELWP